MYRICLSLITIKVARNASHYIYCRHIYLRRMHYSLEVGSCIQCIIYSGPHCIYGEDVIWWINVTLYKRCLKFGLWKLVKWSNLIIPKWFSIQRDSGVYQNRHFRSFILHEKNFAHLFFPLSSFPQLVFSFSDSWGVRKLLSWYYWKLTNENP